MDATQRRQRLREQLASNTCLRPASVFDPISGRIAAALGFEIGMLGGSIASAVVLAAPDMTLLTLTELAGQVRRITRACDVSMIVDADHGYGNALNVMRTVEELEAAGASGLTIEDTALPARFGGAGKEGLIGQEEMLGKLRAALAARQDPETVIFARTHALAVTSLDDAVERGRAYSKTGVDGIFLFGVRSLEQVSALRSVTDLPFMLGNTPLSLDDDALAARGVRLVIRGHLSFGAYVRAVYDSLKDQADGHSPDTLQHTQPAPEVLRLALGNDTYARRQDEFLG